MAYFTIELKTLINSGYRLNLSHYPIFDENYREVLNAKIIKHFYFREIGFETPDRFNFYLGRTMDEIMPYYNSLYKSELLAFDPLATEFYSQKTNEEQDTKRKNLEHALSAKQSTIGDRYSGNIDDISSNTVNISRSEDSTHDQSKSGNKTANLTQNSKENLNETGSANSTTTNDLTTTVNTENEGTGTNQTTGYKTSVFSDIPQAGIETTTEIAPDGTTTITSKGYATTQTTDNTSQSDRTTTNETSDSTSKNTGTVDVEDSHTKQNDNTIDSTAENVENWTEDIDSNQNTKLDEEQDTQSTANKKEDYQHNILENTSNGNKKDSEEKFSSFLDNLVSVKGRKGFSPSQLLKEYRETLINIDIMILNELEKLFMGVFE